MTTTIFDESTDTAFYLCPQCGNSVAEDKIAHEEFFCSRRCLVLFKKDKPDNDDSLNNYQRFVLGNAVGNRKTCERPKYEAGNFQRISDPPAEPGRLRDAFIRVMDLGVFLGDRAKKEGREPFVSGGERMVRLNRLAKQALKP